MLGAAMVAVSGSGAEARSAVGRESSRHGHRGCRRRIITPTNYRRTRLDRCDRGRRSGRSGRRDRFRPRRNCSASSRFAMKSRLRRASPASRTPAAMTAGRTTTSPTRIRSNQLRGFICAVSSRLSIATRDRSNATGGQLRRRIRRKERCQIVGRPLRFASWFDPRR